MREGLYRAVFCKSDPETGVVGDAFGRGVLVLRGSKILGGDSDYYYTGSYELAGTQLDATVTPLTAQPSHRSMFSQGAVLVIKGTADHVGIRCGGTISTSPGDSVQIGLTWLVD
jgi:hypothetical protein